MEQGTAHETAQGTAQGTALIIAGPTCSGKSALALALAQKLGGTVINADSMQVYRELPVLTAQPTAAEQAQVPHRLYGVRPATQPGDAAWWRRAALDVMAGLPCPILCGGTGLYLSALTQGIADVPAPDPAARQEARALLEELGAPGLHARLMVADPETAAGLRPSDGQRNARAWEVWRSTGRGLKAWQAVRTPPPPWRFRMILLDPPRDALRQAIAGRFQAMLDAGALAEVAAVRHFDRTLPAMRAHGVLELLAYLDGRATLTEAGQRTTLVTGQYTKQQATWFRNRRVVDPANLHTIYARYEGLTQLSHSLQDDLSSFLHRQP